MKISAETFHYEVKFTFSGSNFTTVFETGIIDDTEMVIKFLRKKYKGIELLEISKLDF